MGGAGGAGTLDSVRVCVCNAVRAALFWTSIHSERLGARKVRQSFCVVCSVLQHRLLREDEVDQRRLMSPFARLHRTKIHSCP
jgi:hypothetical protein